MTTKSEHETRRGLSQSKPMPSAKIPEGHARGDPLCRRRSGLYSDRSRGTSLKTAPFGKGATGRLRASAQSSSIAESVGRGGRLYFRFLRGLLTVDRNPPEGLVVSRHD
jgi:hypothetical protein